MKIRNTKHEIRNKFKIQNPNQQNICFYKRNVLNFIHLDLDIVSDFGFQISSFILILSCCALAGCTTEYNLATQQQETLLYGTEKEVAIGEAVAAQWEAREELVTDVDVNERVQGILNRITAVCDRKDIVYFIKVIDKDLLNAVSLPGGYIYVFKGLIDKVDNDDQLAGVIAHEVGHITAKHAVKRIQNAYGALILQGLATQSTAQVAKGVNFALTSLFIEHSQEDEFQSDRLSVKYLKKAGYDPREMVKFLEKLKKEQEDTPLRQYSYWRTHPFVSQRISVVNQEITGKLEFRDYLNLMGD